MRAGTVTMVVAEGRRMMRRADELPPETFEALLREYDRVLRRAFEQAGGREVDVDDDTARATFSTIREAAFAAIAVQKAVAGHEWPDGSALAVSVGVHCGEDAEAIARHCDELCDAAEGGQTFLSAAAAGELLAGEDLDGVTVKDVGEQRLRRRDHAVRAYELVA